MVWKKQLIVPGLRLRRNDVHPAAALVERHFAVDEREQSPIAARADVVARYELGAALADDDAARADDLSAEGFHAQAFADAVAAVADASLTFLMCDKATSI